MKNKRFIIKTCFIAVIAFAVIIAWSYPAASSFAADIETENAIPLAAGYSSAEYRLVASLKTAKHGSQTVNQFNSKVWNKLGSDSSFYSAFENVFLNIKKTDSLYQFVRMDLRLSCFEWIADQTGDTPNIGNGFLITKKSGNSTKYYEAGYMLQYDITNGKQITVSERTDLIGSISSDFETYLNSLTTNQLNNMNVERNLNAKLADIINSYTNNGISITGEAYLYSL